MRCPVCTETSDRVLDSRPTPLGDAIRRRRACDGCGHRFTTYERIELNLPLVVKKDGQRDPWSRDKLLSGIFKAVHRRPVSPESVHEFVRGLEARSAESGEREIDSAALGEAVMAFLRQADHIAYVRFASVYREFKDISELLDEVQSLAAAPPKEEQRSQPIDQKR